MRSLILLVALFCVAHPVYTRVSRIHPDEKQKDSLHQTFKNLLNIDDDSETAAPKRDFTKSARAASKYMKRLFERYRKHEMGLGTDSEKTIVRALTPKIGTYQNREALLFDLHSIAATEHLIKAELHYYLGKHPATVDGRAKKVRCYILIPSKSSPGKPSESELPLVLDWDDLSQSKNWAVFDAIKFVNSSIQDSSSASPPSTLAVIFAKGSKEMGASRILNPRKILRLHAPFLSISSRDTAALSISDNIDDRNEEEDESDSSDDDTSVEASRKKREVDSKYYEYYHPYETPFTTSPNDVGYQWRGRTPETTTSHFAQRGPSVLRRTAQSSKARRNKKRRGGSSLARYWEEGNGWPAMEETGKGKKRKYGKILQTKQDEHNPTTLVLLDGKQDEAVVSCQRNDLVVDFQDIGWGDYIIAPSSFEAHYCAGSCTFPIPATVNATNHAIVMDIIQKIRLHPQLPKPCCGPEKMDSLSLLYYDANGNVVLTTYPKMSVLSCACL